MMAVRDGPGNDSLVVGVESAEQLAQHLAVIGAPPLDQETVAALDAAVAGLPAAIVDPANWHKLN
ncbi:hypothetical protein RPMA_09965 [Tardiphaga alba]|uniref:Uncharacterized protein n=1 Tax=Tardiphaga alba TaxID=340268 RepID=A0ABX8A7B6_9BRAD|nr:hypothetical protein [Tardiphaga alba]QUS39127.1 hypothetical protein RPMA_09965 [Tardiphaga alba]